MNGANSNYPDPLPTIGDPPHLDIESTLRQLHKVVHEINSQKEQGRAADTGSQTPMEIQLLRRQKVLQAAGWFVGAALALFSAGVAYQTFIGANAMDSEVTRAVEVHNALPVPDSHPEISEKLEEHKAEIEKIGKSTTSIQEKQNKIEKLTEYNYEAQKWQVNRLQCSIERCRKKPDKPKKLEKLEEDLRYGRY